MCRLTCKSESVLTVKTIRPQQKGGRMGGGHIVLSEHVPRPTELEGMEGVVVEEVRACPASWVAKC